MKSTLLVLFLALLLPLTVLPHGGGLDSQGGHNDRKRGTYHYHRKTTPTPTPSPTQRTLEATPPKPSTQSLQPEAWHILQAQKLHGGKIEVILSDGSRVDLLTDTHAFEIEKASNWKEAVGQTLHYAKVSKRQPGIILVPDSHLASYHLSQLKALITNFHLPIKVLTMENFW